MSVLKRLFDIVRSEVESKDTSHETKDFSTSSERDFSDETVYESNSSHDQEIGYYANLEIEPGADYATIKSSYRALLRRYHPDLHSSDPQKAEIAETVSKGLNEAMAYFEEKHRNGELK